MKKVYILLLLILILFTSSCYDNVSKDDEIDTTSISYISNPDQGFYTPIYINLKKQTDISKYLTYNSQLFHLRIDISNYSKAYNKSEDIKFDTNDLTYLDNILSKFNEVEKNIIIRFAYDPYFEGNKDLEPSLLTMTSHIKSASSIFNKYPSTITAIEVGLIGPWGEMHTSKCANSQTINTLIDTYLDNTKDISILVRTPKMIYDYLGIDIDDIDTYKIDENNKAYRLSIFNDGYLGSDSDLGTYTNRDKETKWLSNQTSHNPFGGEVSIPSSTLHNIENCLDEMNLLNLSYLNIEWNNEVISKWKKTYYKGNDEFNNTTSFDYINAHLGYRFILDDVKVNKNNDNINISLNINNIGFGNLNKRKNIYIYLIDNYNKVHEYDLNYKTNDLSNLNLNITTSYTGTLYLGIKDENKKYPIKFANKDIYNNDLKANYLGIIK